MNKKIKLVMLIVLISISIGANAQTENRGKEPKMVMYAAVGMKPLAFENLYNKLESSGMANPESAFNLGAGAYYNTKSMIFGLDFYNSNGSAENDESNSTYSAFTNSFYVGYKVLNKNALMLAPILGISMTSNSVSVYDRAFEGEIFGNSNAFTLKNSDFSARAGLTFETITKTGLSVGLTSGYDFSLVGNTDWIIKGTDINSGIQDTQGGFFINLIIGGHIFLKQSK